jgi:hypothetical protein
MKYTFLIGAFANVYLLIEYLFFNRMPSLFVVGFWGFYVGISLFLQSATIHLRQKVALVIKNKYGDIINNDNLTLIQKIDRIEKVNNVNKPRR